MKKTISIAIINIFFLSLGTFAAAAELQASSNLSVTAVSTSQINLSWQDNSNNETGFKIERSSNGSSFSEIATVGANITSYSNTGLLESTQYYYRVRAYKVQGNKTTHSAYSNTANATTFSSVVIPNTPSNLNVVTAQSATSTDSWIDLGWTDNATNEDGFAIERSSDGVNFSFYTHIWFPNMNSFRDNEVISGITYYYRVRAFVFQNFQLYYSGYSNVASATAL